MKTKETILLVIAPFVTGFLYARTSQALQLVSDNSKIFTSISIFTICSLVAFSIVKPQNYKALLWIYIKLSISGLLWDITIRLFEGWNDSVFTLPRLLCQLAAMFFAYTLYTKKNLLIIIGASILGISTFGSIKYLNEPASNYTNYGTFSTDVKYKLPENWNIIYNKKLLSNSYSKNKYIVLDFWSKSCAICYEKFPVLDSLYISHKNKKNIEILSVLIQYDDIDSTVAMNKIRSKTYSFQTAFGDTSTARIFHIVAFPTVIIIHDREIIYKGPIEGVNNALHTQ